MNPLSRSSVLWIVVALSALVAGCSFVIDDKCYVYTANFYGIGHLPSAASGMSELFSEYAENYVGVASDQETGFAAGTAAITFNTTTGLQRLPLCTDLSDPVRGIAMDNTVNIVGTVSCMGVDKPAKWGSGVLIILPLPAGKLSGQALGVSGFGFFTGGFASDSVDHAEEHAPRRAVAWTASVPEMLSSPGGSGWSSTEIHDVGGEGWPTRSAACGAYYNPVLGRSASLQPCYWTYEPNMFLAGVGDWTSHRLGDDTGSEARGLAKEFSNQAGEAILLGQIEKAGVLQPCLWRHPGSGPFVKAEIFPTLQSGDEAVILAHNGDSLFVGVERMGAEDVAVLWDRNVAKNLKDALNEAVKDIVPADWKLTRATRVLSDGVTVTLCGTGVHAGQTEGWVFEARVTPRPMWRCWIDEHVPFMHHPTWLDELKNRPREFPPGRPADFIR